MAIKANGSANGPPCISLLNILHRTVDVWYTCKQSRRSGDHVALS